MIVKIDRYRVRPDQLELYERIQKRAAQIYRKYIQIPSLLLRNQDDPSEWIEIHWFPDEETYHRGMNLVNTEPEISDLWLAFQQVLDPQNPVVQEEYFDQIDLSRFMPGS